MTQPLRLVTFVTGHSLGAALATLATADLVNSGAASRAGMYSFAGPRTGDLAFAAEFNRRVAVGWRIVNTEDIVTTVPLATPELFSSDVPQQPIGDGVDAGAASQLRARRNAGELYHTQRINSGESRHAGLSQRVEDKLIVVRS